jgi:hypothetical protein
MTPEERAELDAANREIRALKAERARLAQRLELASAETRAMRASRDAALQAAVWGPPPRGRTE